MWRLQLADENVFVGTVEGFPKADIIIDQLQENGVEKAWLMPFMSVAGDHAQNDMAGSGKDSWRFVFENAGIACETVMKGTAEYDAFVDIWVGHLKNALSALNTE
ncbi:MAG: sirohydrochlorin cobaltochelatase, partial [Thermodesulfobacteriota bacterium]